MSKRLINLLLALALAVSAFAGLTVAPAGAAQEVPDQAIYFPWLPNGEEYGDMGPWHSAFTIQNIEPFAITVDIFAANGTQITTASLVARASKTWTAAQVFGQDNPGGGIYAVAQPINGPLEFDNVTRGTGNTDSIPVGTCQVNLASVTVTQGDTTFTAGTDYVAAQQQNPLGPLTITWQQGGNAPAAGTTYTVTATCTNQINPRIGGVVKEVTPVEPVSGAWTSDQHEAVTGYTSLPGPDVNQASSWSFPIVQTNNGWDTVLHITNFDDDNGNCSVSVALYAADSGVTGPSEGNFSQVLAKGETWHLDLGQIGWPAGWVGSAFVTADCALGATVNRLKASQPWGTPVNMAMTNVAQPTGENQNEVYGPLVYQAYNGWNTGIAIANLDADNNNAVQITFYNKDGSVVFSESRTIQPRGMEFLYLPSVTDIGTNSLAQVIITGTENVAAAIDAVKYTGVDQDVGQATSYLAQGGTEAGGTGQVNGTLSVALVQKQQGLTQQRDNSGIALFNGDTTSPATVEGSFYDGAGSLVAPTLAGPIQLTLPPAGGAILYTPFYGEMPSGFRGSFQAEVTGGGPVSCVSNNVNYEVQFDGTATYNCFVTQPQ